MAQSRRNIPFSGDPVTMSTSSKDLIDLTYLAAQAAIISKGLNNLRQSCGHESTSTEIANAAEELALISTELKSLDREVAANRQRYTDAFGEDVAEIRNHLSGIFEDITDCCKEMQKADGPNTSAVGWLTKKRYVRRLQKHLAANKTTLVVMRTVLHHGKEYGKHNSPGRLAEASPHTLQEDLAILETVFASRNAIKDLQNTANKSHEHTSSASSAGVSEGPSFEPGSHGRNLSSATGVDIPATGDVLPASKADEKKRKDDALARRFSRRGVRLAVHTSIMGTNAHEVPLSLRKRWINQARMQDSLDQASIAQLSRISEVNSNPSPDDDQSSLNTPNDKIQKGSDETSSDDPPFAYGTTKAKKRSHTLMASPLGRQLGKVIHRLSRTSVDDNRPNGEGDEAVVEHKRPEVETRDDPEGSQKLGWSYRLTKRFVRSELTTPDFNHDAENMALR